MKAALPFCLCDRGRRMTRDGAPRRCPLEAVPYSCTPTSLGFPLLVLRREPAFMRSPRGEEWLKTAPAESHNCEAGPRSLF